MDKNAFQRFVLPFLTALLGTLGKYILPAICAFTGMESAKANDWWTGTAQILAGIGLALLTSWLTKKKILTTAAAVTDAKIEAVAVANDLAPGQSPVPGGPAKWAIGEGATAGPPIDA
ncbi:MAG: hypothetical protein IMZ55_06380 [Acidobacteria bacterium]|nr:hypothetical protein [Acidobacteriota bacterium]